MQKIQFGFITSTFVILALSNCNNNPNATDLDNWVGIYSYEEIPIEAIAGYGMVMDWHLSVSRQNNSYQGMLEVDGQQTLIKLKANIEGDSSQIAVIYDSLV